jgi:tetratricopeptide (TPR) repeat protein
MQSLAEWIRNHGSPAEYFEAAEAMARMTTDNPVAFAYRAEARLRIRDRDGAKDDFRRSVALAPDYAFAVLNLFDLELGDENFVAAGQLLEALRVHVGGEYVVAREVQLAMARADHSVAAEALERLAISPQGDSDWPLRAADRAFVETGWGRRAEAVYSSLLDRPGIKPLVGALWIERCISRQDWSCANRLGELLARGEVGIQAAHAYFNALAGARASRKIHSAIRRHEQALRSHSLCWGVVGYALLTINHHRAVIDWMSDWHERAAVEPWMLNNLIYSLRALKRDDEANKISRRALELPRDNTTRFHQLWLALDDLFEADHESAGDRLEGLDTSNFDAGDRFLYSLAKLLLNQALTKDEAQGRGMLVATTSGRELVRLCRATVVTPETHGAILHTYRRAVRMMARNYGPSLALMWRFLHMLVAPRRGR